MSRSTALIAAILYIGCANHGASPPPDVAAGGASPRVMQVSTPGGGTEPVWIYVATPSGPGPYPVVIYGHGQGTGDLVNCLPDRAPDDEDAVGSEHIADALAAEGYLTIAVFYRSRGAEIPAIGELRARDHYVFDARALLSAAHLAHDELGGSSRVALIGVSMGSFPATWAVAPLPQLADLQPGLEIVTTIPTAMLGNLIGNTGRSKSELPTAGGIALAGLAAIEARSALALDPSITAADLTTGVTPAGAELVKRMFLAAGDPALAGCASQTVPAACNASCAAATFTAVAAEHGLGTSPLDWLTQDTIDAVEYWNPPTAIDPGANTSNAMLAAQRLLSPAYTLTGPLLARRLLPLASAHDHVITGQLAGSKAPGDLYIARLLSTGVAMPDPIPTVTAEGCEHGNYLDPSRPQCGWMLVLDELSTAFAM